MLSLIIVVDKSVYSVSCLFPFAIHRHEFLETTALINRERVSPHIVAIDECDA